MSLHTVERPEDLPSPVPDARFVVVDVVITSTAVVRLLEEGAEYVRPLTDEEDAASFEERTEDAVLVGEQGGAPVDGFDLSPLPSVFEGRDLDGRPVGILTTNGTRAVDRICRDRDIYMGSTVNARAVASSLDDVDTDVWLVAAGRFGEPTPEDTAGVELIRSHYDDSDPPDADRLRDEIRGSATAGWIRELGFGHEIDAVLDFDSTDTVPRIRDGVFVAD